MPIDPVRGIGAWLILVCAAGFAFAGNSEAPRDRTEALAQALLAAHSEQERGELLEKSQDVPPADLVPALIAQSEALRKKPDYSAATVAADLARQVADASGDARIRGDAALQQGRVRYFQNQYAEAMEFFTSALDLAKQLPDAGAQAKPLTYMGKCFVQQGKDAEGREWYVKSLDISRASGDMRQTAETLNAMCFVDQNLTQYDRADQECSESLRLRRQIGDREATAESLMAGGRLAYMREKYDSAIEFYQESLKVYEELGYTYYIGYLQTCIGSFYLAEENYVQALAAYEKGLATAESIGDSRTFASALETIGEIHRSQGNYDVALEYFQRSLDLFQKLQMDLYVAVVQDFIGQVYLHKGETATALTWLNRAMSTYQDQNSARNVAFIHTEFGDLQFQQGDYDAAAASYSKALEIATAADVPNTQATALKNLGAVANKRGRYEEALDFLRRAAAIGAETNHPDVQWESLEIIGQALAAMGRPDEARQAFEQSIAIVEGQRLNVAGGAEDRQRFFASRMEPYQFLIEFLIRQGDLSGAFLYAERARARVLVESLSQNKLDPQDFMTPSERSQDQIRMDAMAAVNRQILNEGQKENPDASQLKALNEQLQKARNDHEASRAALYANHPEIRLQRGDLPSVTMEAAEALLPSSTVFMEYVVMADKTYVFVLRPDPVEQHLEIRLLTIHKSRKDLAGLVDAFRHKLASLDLDFAGVSKELYELLLQPAQDLIRGSRNLLIVPDGELWNVPFAALLSPANRYLLEDHALVEVPSLAALREMMKARKGHDSAASSLFALGNPAPAVESLKQVKQLYRGETLGPLPDAEREVKLLGQLYGPSRSRVYTGKQAAKDRFKREAGGYQILHIATHGILNDATPLYSQLVLAPGASPGSEDGLLEAWDIMNLKLNANLAVLSACETGRGNIGSGEGLIGLSWAFLVAGVPTTVVSQWKVESKSTTELMVKFHRELLSGTRGADFQIAGALRKASLWLLRQPAYRHPFYWAGFFVLGSAS